MMRWYKDGKRYTSLRYKQPEARRSAEAALRERFVVDEEEYEKDGIGSGEGDARDHVDRLRDADRVRWFFFANLDETWLKEINLQMNDDTES